MCFNYRWRNFTEIIEETDESAVHGKHAPKERTEKMTMVLTKLEKWL